MRILETIEDLFNPKAGTGEWKDMAACTTIDPDLFFPIKGGDNRAAKKICARCEVKIDCLSLGLYEREGVWGGLSQRERQTLRAKNRWMMDNFGNPIGGRPSRETLQKAVTR